MFGWLTKLSDVTQLQRAQEQLICREVALASVHQGLRRMTAARLGIFINVAVVEHLLTSDPVLSTKDTAENHLALALLEFAIRKTG